MWYKLVGKIPVPASVEEATECFNGDTRVVGLTALPDGGKVSTVFLGLDHSHGGDRPVLFETMVFLPDGQGEDCVRYFTWDEAEQGHKELVIKYSKSTEHLDEDLFKV